MQSSCRKALTAIAVLMVPLGGCSSSSSGRPTATSVDLGSATADSATPNSAPPPTSANTPATDPARPSGSGLTAGPVTYIALGDSLTAGDGDDTYQGYVGVIAAAIGAAPGRADVSVVNLGASGWDSTMMVDGQDGAPGQLGQAVEQATEAVAAGRAVLATVLIGSNDLWYLYEYGPPDGTPPASEDAAEETFRANLDRTVQELTDAGAVVVVGLPDDQSRRPSVADIDRLHDFLPDITVDEVQQMVVMAARLDRVAEDVAADHGALTVDTNAPFWADEGAMADDGIHPNTAGYADLAELWLATIGDLL